MSKNYQNRNIQLLDKRGGYYFRHVSALTGEGLHSKSAIAAELAYRDAVIAHLVWEIKVAATALELNGTATLEGRRECAERLTAALDFKFLGLEEE